VKLSTYISVLKRAWIVVVASGLIGTCIGFVIYAYSPPKFEASTKLYVGVTAVEGADAGTLAAGASFARQSVASYVQIVTSARILDPVIEDLSLNVSVNELAAKTEVFAPLSAGINTSLMQITVENSDPDLASEIANSIAFNLARTIVDDFEQPEGNAPGQVTVDNIQPALAPTMPSSGSLALFGLIGALFGVSAGFLLTFAVNRLNTRIHTTTDLRNVSSLPIFGGLRLETEARIADRLQEAVRVGTTERSVQNICTHLSLLATGGGPQSFAFAGGHAGFGTTTTTLAVAMEMAHRGSSVVVIDGDSGESRIAKILGLGSKPGLIDVLQSTTSYKEALVGFGQDDMYVLPSGSASPEVTADLLSRSEMTHMMNSMTREFDYVFVDCPPVLGSADALAIAKTVTNPLLIVALGNTTTAQVKACIELFGNFGAQFTGAVLTRVCSQRQYWEHRDTLAAAPGRRRGPGRYSVAARRTRKK